MAQVLFHLEKEPSTGRENRENKEKKKEQDKTRRGQLPSYPPSQGVRVKVRHKK